MVLPVSKENILQLIPQRPPMVMIDSLLDAHEDEALSALTITSDNVFVRDEHLLSVGILEHIAQSAAAYLGWYTNDTHLGYIGEVKRCTNLLPVPVGKTITTRLHKLAELDGVRLFEAQSTVDGCVVAECQMKVFLKEEETE